ncbi:MICAL-like protein 1 isoform X2 [Argiope bruennichi]|uniref:MICAL-like protein 2 like protein n=1 Tax=Argiope bruennichi TaxID=94029 RepID=A0A8T0ETS5_ARGBR|nr:MICAL-like protein 1 isoform X2 [Argiope bruennichi]KAF8777419.1 MICAL-like protein 2 like protein [Argiope bruennichi]
MMDNQAKGLIKGLENWAKRVTKGYKDVDVNNLSSSFRDGLAFCAIIHHYRPDLIDFESLSKENVFENNNLAFSTAERQLGIQALLDAEDMVKLEKPDRLCIITYLSQLYNYFENQNKVKTLKPGIKRPQSNSSGPASKVAVVQPRLLTIKHEVCHVCKHRVFILERLIVDNKLYHRDCFRCSKCNALLNPGAYVESDTDGLYECAVCLPEENSDSMDTQDASYDSSEDKNGSLSNVSSKQPSPILRRDVSTKPLISEAVNSARTNFLQNSLSPKSPELRKISPILKNGASSAENTSSQSVKDDSVDSGISVKDKISVFESNRNSKFGSFSKTPELSNSSTLTPSSSAPASDSATPGKSLRTSAILSFNSSSANKSTEVTTSRELTENATQSKEITNKVELIESTAQPKIAVDRIKPNGSRSLSSDVISSNSKEMPETSRTTGSHLDKFSESQSDKLNCDNSASVSVLSKVPNSTFRHSLNLETLPKEESLSKISPSKSFQIGEYKSPFKASRDIFQTSLQPLKLGIPTASSTPKKESLSLPQTPITSPDSPRIGNVEIPQIRSTYSRTLPRPGSASNLLSKDKHNEPNSTSETDLSDSNISRLSSTGRRSSLESYSTSSMAANEDANVTSGSIKSMTEENKSSSITSLKAKNSNFQLSSTLGSNIKSENNLLKRQFNDVPVPSVRHSLEIKRLSPLKTAEPTDNKNSSVKPSDTVNEKSLSISSVDTPPKSNVEVPKIETKSAITKVVKPKVIEPPKSEKEYPDDLNPFGAEEEEEEYPDDLNPFGDDDGEEGANVKIKVVSADDYDESKNPFASDEEDNNAEVVTPQSKPVTPKTAPVKTASPFQSVWTSSPTGSLKGTTKKRKAPKPPMVTDIFPNDSQDSEADVSFNSLKSSPSGSRISLQTPSPKLRKNKPAPPPPPVLANKNSQPDDIANSKQMKDADNMKLKTSTASADANLAKKKKRPAPPVPIPKRKDNKKIPLKEIIREMKEIEEKQKECERQGREIELLIRDRDKDEEPTVEEEEYIMQLFDLVNQKNALFRRQAELMYIKRSQRLEEQQAEIEMQIRQLLMKPDSEKTEEDRTREEELILELKDIVDQRSSIIDSIEMDRRRELEEDASVQEQIEIKNAEIKEKSSGKKKDKKAKKEKKKKDKGKKEEADNDDSKKSSGKKKGLFK